MCKPFPCWRSEVGLGERLSRSYFAIFVPFVVPSPCEVRWGDLRYEVVVSQSRWTSHWLERFAASRLVKCISRLLRVAVLMTTLWRNTHRFFT